MAHKDLSSIEKMRNEEELEKTAKEKRRWRMRTILLIGTSLTIAVCVAVVIPICIFRGCSSDDYYPSSTTSKTPETTTYFVPGDGERMVSTNYGPIIGHEVDVGGRGLLHETVISYLGVPYAKPPVGPLRWKRPEAPEPWDQPFIADTLPNMCHQSPLVIRGTHGGWDRFHEDCLYMQIYTPKDTSKGLYPVMLYFHGGMFQISGSIQYPGHYYAIRDVIMIAINYRLGIFGFASTDEPAKDSNYGLWDMYMALKFVKENIQYFGGDPDKITIFGESAGAVSVGLFLLSPLTKGMFNQAILQSGAELGWWAVQDPDDGRKISFMILADKLKCARTTNAEMMDCMRQIDAGTIFDSDIECDAKNCREYRPVIDGPEGLVQKLPIQMREEGHGHPVKIMVGTNKDENSFSTLALCPSCLFLNMTRLQFTRNVRRAIGLRSDWFTRDTAEDDIYEATLLTYSPWPFIHHGELNKIHLGDISSDRLFNAPANRMLDFHCKVAECYQYVFDVKMTLGSGTGLFPRWMGVPHGMELPFVFSWPLLQTSTPEVTKDTGNLSMPLGVTFADKDRWWTDYTIDLWTNFAKFGNPTPEPVSPPEHSRPVTWYNQSIDRKWYLHIDNEFPDKNPTKNKLNYRPVETAFAFNYEPTLARGHDLHENRNQTSPARNKNASFLAFGFSPKSYFQILRDIINLNI